MAVEKASKVDIERRIGVEEDIVIFDITFGDGDVSIFEFADNLESDSFLKYNKIGVVEVAHDAKVFMIMGVGTAICLDRPKRVSECLILTEFSLRILIGEELNLDSDMFTHIFVSFPTRKTDEVLKLVDSLQLK